MATTPMFLPGESQGPGSLVGRRRLKRLSSSLSSISTMTMNYFYIPQRVNVFRNLKSKTKLRSVQRKLDSQDIISHITGQILELLWLMGLAAAHSQHPGSRGSGPNIRPSPTSLPYVKRYLQWSHYKQRSYKEK